MKQTEEGSSSPQNGVQSKADQMLHSFILFDRFFGNVGSATGNVCLLCATTSEEVNEYWDTDDEK